MTQVNPTLKAAAQRATAIVNGPQGAKNISALGGPGSVSVLGLPAAVNIFNAEAANDQLIVNALAGDDVVSAREVMQRHGAPS